MRRIALLLMLATLSLAFAPAPLPSPDPGKDDLKRMQGPWAIASDYTDGVLARPLGLRVVISPTRLTFFLGAAPTQAWAITLDAKAKPKALDMRLDDKSGQPGRLLEAVYAFEGDALKLSFNDNWGKRPADLAGKGPSRRLLVLRREKR